MPKCQVQVMAITAPTTDQRQTAVDCVSDSYFGEKYWSEPAKPFAINEHVNEINRIKVQNPVVHPLPSLKPSCDRPA